MRSIWPHFHIIESSRQLAELQSATTDHYKLKMKKKGLGAGPIIVTQCTAPRTSFIYLIDAYLLVYLGQPYTNDPMTD